MANCCCWDNSKDFVQLPNVNHTINVICYRLQTSGTCFSCLKCGRGSSANKNCTFRSLIQLYDGQVVCVFACRLSAQTMPMAKFSYTGFKNHYNRYFCKTMNFTWAYLAINTLHCNELKSNIIWRLILLITIVPYAFITLHKIWATISSL